MKKHGIGPSKSGEVRISPPAYPFDARRIWGDLWLRLGKEHGRDLGFRELGKMIGKSKSTVHFWFTVYRHPHLLAFMALVERLSPEARQAFIGAHCREFPTFGHPRLVQAAEQLKEVLRQQAGMTIITGGTDEARTFVLTALGHESGRMPGRPLRVAGIDLHRPLTFVPIETLIYIDCTHGLDHCRQLISGIWARVLTSAAPRLLFNCVWSAFPDLQNELLRCARNRHVLLAEKTVPDMIEMKRKLSTPINVLTLTTPKSDAGRIYVHRKFV
jgi:hypothetical protein